MPPGQQRRAPTYDPSDTQRSVIQGKSSRIVESYALVEVTVAVKSRPSGASRPRALSLRSGSVTCIQRRLPVSGDVWIENRSKRGRSQVVWSMNLTDRSARGVGARELRPLALAVVAAMALAAFVAACGNGSGPNTPTPTPNPSISAPIGGDNVPPPSAGTGGAGPGQNGPTGIVGPVSPSPTPSPVSSSPSPSRSPSPIASRLSSTDSSNPSAGSSR
jgi:hypothetical protein